MITCRGRMGVAYEFHQAEPFSRVIQRDPDSVERHTEVLHEVVRKVHAVRSDLDQLPVLQDRVRNTIECTRGDHQDADVGLQHRRHEAMPEPERCVHFDLHSSNIVLRRGQPVNIDMGDLSRGSHWFDVALRFTIYGVPDLGLSKLACGIPVPYGLRLCNAFERRSMADFGSAERACFEENRFVLASLRLLCAFEIAPARKPWFLETTRTALGPGIRSPTRR